MSHNSSLNSPRVVVMTGATSRIGAAALQHIAGEPDTQVIVGARGSGAPSPPVSRRSRWISPTSAASASSPTP
ncbi:hypothetical protein [Streptomyces hokutonensis]|uniref:hypothetical protein n=1 Tax=Streptomyces hokutonensis TaxID=1306990 RepID=UPI001C3F2501|nr:hypothetical protein [Streptomyces hokutonensis]